MKKNKSGQWRNIQILCKNVEVTANCPAARLVLRILYNISELLRTDFYILVCMFIDNVLTTLKKQTFCSTLFSRKISELFSLNFFAF